MNTYILFYLCITIDCPGKILKDPSIIMDGLNILMNDPCITINGPRIMLYDSCKIIDNTNLIIKTWRVNE